MKLLHCADIHLGSKINSKLPPQKGAERRMELRLAFNKMINYAKASGIKAILIAGDAFDSDRPLKTDKEFFYDAVKACSDIDFFYLRGNHDRLESFEDGNVKNLKTFGEEWTTYEYGFLAISGVEFLKDNAASIYSSASFRRDKFNVVMLHGQIADTVQSGNVVLNALKGKNVNYLALGHVHSFSHGKFGDATYAYSGCLEGRGFDETGEKGFIVLDVLTAAREKNGDFSRYGFSFKFVRNSIRVIKEKTIDISTADGTFAAMNLISAELEKDGEFASPENELRVNLIGECDFDVLTAAREIEKNLSLEFFFAEVKNKTENKVNLDEFLNDPSIKGEFVRKILESDLSDGRKREVIKIGLKAIDGRRFEL